VSQQPIKIEEALALHQGGHIAQAKAICEQIVAAEPRHDEALHLLGVIAYQMHNLAQATQLMSRAIDVNPTNAIYYFNRGLVLQSARQLKAAIESYKSAVSINSDFAEAYTNLGNALQELNQLNKAIECYDHALRRNPNSADTYFNRGLALKMLNQFNEAMESYNSAIKLKPDFVEVYVERGAVLVKLRQLDEAVASYEKALALKPDFEYLLGTLLYTKLKLCDWHDLQINTNELLKRINADEKYSPGFPLLYLTNSLSVQKKAAILFASDKYPINHELGDISKHTRSEKIRIGYFSGDFHFHPVSILMAELFERHDKNKFELIAFSFGPDLNDGMRQRIQSSFDQFIDIQNKPDKEVAQLARKMNITIAVDLGGASVRCRTGIFAYRAAPIQVNYLGYPGTMGADYFDYLIADKMVIPEEAKPYYTEKIAYLPSYQPNDSTRFISDRKFTKQDLGLPDEGFVFCCFNDNYKIMPDTFDGWMRILQSVPDSVLFLYKDNSMSEKNLKKEAEARGVDAGRLIFANRLKDRGDYLARYRCVDLFLDTFPYNAQATASDVLWSGLPLLTRAGETFASRVAASLLTAIELPELITYTQEEYESLAIELATHPTTLKMVKERLADHRLKTLLFDTTLFTKHIEEAYTKMVERYDADQTPDHIYVECLPRHH
jgi:protein O-GlcNAc transferase